MNIFRVWIRPLGTDWQEDSGSETKHRPSLIVHGVRMIQKPKQRAVKQARSILKSCRVGPSPELQASPEPRNVAAEDVQGDLDEINTMISEGSPTR
jgi:hypothetical protein